MAADILTYKAALVPIGIDQEPHLELTREIARKFNNRFGDTFVLPKAVMPKAGARVMDLQDPTSKMSKSAATDAGLISMLDDPALVMKKFKRAVTDSDNEVRFDRAAKPGVSNLLEILAACTGGTPEALAANYTQYGALKVDTGEAVVATLAPIQARYNELMASPRQIEETLQAGAEKARSLSRPLMDKVRHSVGIRPLG